MKTPVAFIIFNRPEETARVFKEISRARPPMLLVVADGPRAGREGEAERCADARAVIERVDWDCEVLTNFSDVNLGCKRRVSSGIDWIFETVEEAIILEDDCLPHPTFFPFCEELLARFRQDERVMGISGDNFQFGARRTSYSYYFSRYMHIWGWASWRRAWQHYDVEIKLWPELRETSMLADMFNDEESVRAWQNIYDKLFEGAIDTWDYQWMLSIWAQSGLVALPEVNLISNIGFGQGGTHTVSASGSIMANLPTAAMSFPLKHPPYVIRHREADEFTTRKTVTGQDERNLYRRLRRKLASVMATPKAPR